MCGPIINIILFLGLPPRGQRHGVNDIHNRKWAAEEDHLKHAPTATPALHKPFAVTALPGKPAVRVVHDIFDFPDRATVFGRVVAIRVVPPEVFHRPNVAKFGGEVKIKVLQI